MVRWLVTCATEVGKSPTSLYPQQKEVPSPYSWYRTMNPWSSHVLLLMA